jgi:transcriptional regulator GlxA family with amidase domain
LNYWLYVHLQHLAGKVHIPSVIAWILKNGSRICSVCLSEFVVKDGGSGYSCCTHSTQYSNFVM